MFRKRVRNIGIFGKITQNCIQNSNTKNKLSQTVIRTLYKTSKW